MPSRTITARSIRQLNLATPHKPFLAAASGLVQVRSRLYVVADDELQLGVFGSAGKAPGELYRLFAGALPAKHKARKKRKPDLEALALLPPGAGRSHGALLVLGSGSRPNRRRAALVRLDADGHLAGKPEALDLGPLYRRLENELDSLNIEGAVVRGDALLLFQRGNRKGGENAVIHLPLAATLAALRAGKAERRFEITRQALGRIDGVALGFTDAAVLPDGAVVFTAVAEDTGDSFDDGPCRGAAIGLLDPSGRRQWLRRLRGRIKVEGVHARRKGRMLELLLVSDADDAAVPARLYRATTPFD